jgi:hypothetical protein
VSPNSLSYLISFGFIALFLAGCGGDTSKPSNSSAPSPSASAVAPASAAPVASAAPNFGQPLVKSSDTKASPVALVSPQSVTLAGLLPASDSDAVVRSTAKGRTDPFANVVLQTIVERAPSNGISPASQPVAPRKIAAASRSSAPDSDATDSPDSSDNVVPTKTSRVSSGLGTASVADMARKKPNSAKIAVGPKPIPLVSAPSKSGTVSAPPALTPVDPTRTTALRDLPKPSAAPQPALASAIHVSGVAQVNGQTQVILKLPNEAFSRYISVGERVMDGKVLIKRVENPSAITPVVILEEVGIEVPRKVGEKPVIASKDAPR